ncbi:MAG TPA: serine hydrolase, partial [Mycobacterium sp.]
MAAPPPTPAPVAAPPPPTAPPPPDAAPAPDFAAVSKLMNDAIAKGTAPGGVVEIGHGGKVVFH